jgi:hypothetical protein
VSKVDTGGISEVYAGGEVGFEGNGGPARQAAMKYISGLTLDHEGNFRIRVVRIPTRRAVATRAGRRRARFRLRG